MPSSTVGGRSPSKRSGVHGVPTGPEPVGSRRSREPASRSTGSPRASTPPTPRRSPSPSGSPPADRSRRPRLSRAGVGTERTPPRKEPAHGDRQEPDHRDAEVARRGRQGLAGGLGAAGQGGPAGARGPVEQARDRSPGPAQEPARRARRRGRQARAVGPFGVAPPGVTPRGVTPLESSHERQEHHV